MIYIQVKKEVLDQMLEHARIRDSEYFQGKASVLIEILQLGEEIDSENQKIITKEQLFDIIVAVGTDIWLAKEISWDGYTDKFWKDLK